MLESFLGLPLLGVDLRVLLVEFPGLAGERQLRAPRAPASGLLCASFWSSFRYSIMTTKMLPIESPCVMALTS